MKQEFSGIIRVSYPFFTIKHTKYKRHWTRK